MERNELLRELDYAQQMAGKHGVGMLLEDQSALYGDAANEIRHLLVYIEQLKSDKHWLNERLLNAQTDIQLLQAQARRND